MSGTPITITLYGANDEEKQTFSRTVIPWGILKKAIALSKSINEDAVGSQDIDAIAGLVVEAFGNQFTIQDLDVGADVGEMISVLKNIVARAGALVQANPTMAPGSRKKKRSR
jgi:hypothetical protein